MNLYIGENGKSKTNRVMMYKFNYLHIVSQYYNMNAEQGRSQGAINS